MAKRSAETSLFPLTPLAEKELDATIHKVLEEYRQDLLTAWARQIRALPLPLFAQVSEEYGAGYRRALADAAVLLSKQIVGPAGKDK